MRRERLLRVLRSCALLFTAGSLYALFVARTGLAVPCLFRRITGLKCPGCGVTQMCVALLRLDVTAAFWSNPMLFVLAPVLAVIFVRYLTGYVRNGTWKMSRAETGLLYVSAGLLIAFAVVRNLWA